MASRIRIDTLRLEDEQSTINLWPFLPFNKGLTGKITSLFYNLEILSLFLK